MNDPTTTSARADFGYDEATEPKRPEMSLGELFQEMTGELGTLFRKEIEDRKSVV